MFIYGTYDSSTLQKDLLISLTSMTGNIKVACQTLDRPMGRIFSRSEIGTDSCYSLFERGEKTVQAKIIKFYVGSPKRNFVYLLRVYGIPELYT